MTIKHVRDHVEVYDGTKFQFSADTEQEARKELEEMKWQNSVEDRTSW